MMSSILYRVIFVFTALVGGSLTLYWMRSITALSAWCLFSVMGLVGIGWYMRVRTKEKISWRKYWSADFLQPSAVLIAAIDLSILVMVFAVRTGEPLVTPWQILPWTLFIFYGIATTSLVYWGNSYARAVWATLALLHVGVSLIVSAGAYGVGFGFDPFIHRAAESALATYGTINPQQILYSGQYALIGAIRVLTGISINILDIWYVPLLSAFLVVFASYVGLKEGWRLPESYARLGWVATLCIPYALLTFSVPFTFTYAQYVILPFVLPLIRDGVWWQRAIWAGFYAVGVFFHPLLLIPASALIIIFFGWNIGNTPKIRALISIISSVCGLVLGVAGLPLALTIYQHSKGVMPHLDGLRNASIFFSLFSNPFGPWEPRISVFFNSIFIWRYWVPVLALGAGIVALWVYRQKIGTRVAAMYTLYIGILFINMYSVSTLFVFQDIISYEQKEFALRLLQATYASGGLGLALLLGRLFDAKGKARVIVALLVGVQLTLTWYFSYPLWSAKYVDAPSVSAQDVQTVQAIDEYAQGRPYIVLSNQLLSAAAIQEFGFRDYISFDGESVLWYAIPTGGILYEYYLDALFYQRVDRIQELAERTDVDLVFVVYHTYWPIEESDESLLTQASGDILEPTNITKVFIFSYGEANPNEHQDQN